MIHQKKKLSLLYHKLFILIIFLFASHLYYFYHVYIIMIFFFFQTTLKCLSWGKMLRSSAIFTPQHAYIDLSVNEIEIFCTLVLYDKKKINSNFARSIKNSFFFILYIFILTSLIHFIHPFNFISLLIYPSLLS